MEVLCEIDDLWRYRRIKRLIVVKKVLEGIIRLLRSQNL